MDKSIGKEYPAERRIQFLEDNCDKVDKKGYMKRFSAEELQEMKERLSEVSIDINDIEIEKKATVEVFKIQLAPLTTERTDLLKSIKNKATFVSEDCFKFVDTIEKMVGYYNSEGDLIDCRPANIDELNGTIHQTLRKVENN